MAGNIHPGVQDANDFKASVILLEIQQMSADEVFQIAGANIRPPALTGTRCQGMTGIAKIVNILPGLIHAPLFGGVAPDVRQIRFRCW